MKMTEKSFSRNCYYICMAVIGYSVAGYLIMRMFHWSPDKIFPPCRFYESTGYYCMGCGGTRALIALFQGHFLQSLRYHPVVEIAAGFLFLFLPSQTLSILTKDKICGMILKPVYFYVIAGIVILQWLIKNGILYFFHIAVI